jgi:Arc/MetJ-type ribon-helix-helix transcriptional regulator
MEAMKQPISVTVEKELVEWIDQQVKTLTFRNRSHLVEVALMQFKENMERGKEGLSSIF